MNTCASVILTFSSSFSFSFVLSSNHYAFPPSFKLHSFLPYMLPFFRACLLPPFLPSLFFSTSGFPHHLVVRNSEIQLASIVWYINAYVIAYCYLLSLVRRVRS